MARTRYLSCREQSRAVPRLKSTTTLHWALRDPLVRYEWCAISKKVRTISLEKFGIWTLLLCFNVTACCVGWPADDGRRKIGWQRGGGWEQIDPYCSTIKEGGPKRENCKTGLTFLNSLHYSWPTPLQWQLTLMVLWSPCIVHLWTEPQLIKESWDFKPSHYLWPGPGQVSRPLIGQCAPMLSLSLVRSWGATKNDTSVTHSLIIANLSIEIINKSFNTWDENKSWTSRRNFQTYLRLE